MKKNLVLMLTGMSLTALLGPACQKVVTYEENHPGVYNACRIEGFDLESVARAQRVNYNAAGLPVSVEAINPAMVGGGTVNQYFRYDYKNRLTDYQILYVGGTAPVLWFRYTYPRPHIVIDSQYAYSTGPLTAVNPNPSSIEFVTVDSFDNLDRLVKRGGGPLIKYDGKGNNVTDPGVAYDNYISAYRTSYTWMFIFQYFSTNNLLEDSITSYNLYGLPLDFGKVTAGDLFGMGPQGVSTVSYSCGPVQKAGL